MTQRTVIAALAGLEDGPVKVQGWVDTVRDQKKVQFVVLRDETGLPVTVAEDPLTCVARGGGRALELLDKHGNEFFAHD